MAISRRALVVGIDRYSRMSRLYGCVNDAQEVAKRLRRNGDDSVNFTVREMLGTANNVIDRTDLRDAIRELFTAEGEIALFYFAGHGHVEVTGGYLCASDTPSGDDGLPLGEIITLARGCKARNKIIILDSCFSGIAGDSAFADDVAQLPSGVTILTASTKTQYASEDKGSGVFTTLMLSALDGGAANLLGDITPGSVYAHIDQTLGDWGQRPVFKTNVKYFVSLRKVTPPISLANLHRLTEFFPEPSHDFPLDPSYEPEHELADPVNNDVFRILQSYNRFGLLVPVGAPHMWHAAVNSKSCKLTVLGEHYRNLVAKDII